MTSSSCHLPKFILQWFDYWTIHNTQNRSAKPKHQNNMSYAHGFASAWSPESQGAIINADEHSLSAHSLISAKEERWNSFFFLHEFSAKSRKKNGLGMPQEGEVQIPQNPPGPNVPVPAPGNAAARQPAGQQARQPTAEEKLEVNFSFVYPFLFAGLYNVFGVSSFNVPLSAFSCPGLVAVFSEFATDFALPLHVVGFCFAYRQLSQEAPRVRFASKAYGWFLSFPFFSLLLGLLGSPFRIIL